MPASKIQFIIDNLQESLDVEVKNWLDGLTNKSDKAALAKEIIALANHGGGYIFIGFDDQGAELPEIEPADREYDAFTQDAIAEIVHRYVTPPCQCSLETISLTNSNIQHPVIIVPGNHRTPLFAARGGPNGELDSGKVYVRRPGGYSEAARTQDDWEKLIERLVKARQSDMLTAIREVLEPSSRVLAEKESTLENWHSENINVWDQIVDKLNENDPRRLQKGYWTVSFAIQPFHAQSLVELNTTLDRDMPKYSGWPPFTYLHRDPVRPKAQGQYISAYLGALAEGELPDQRVAHCDFWRISRDGQGFMLRPMREDLNGYLGNVYPRPEGPFFDWIIPIYRMTEILKFIEALADKFSGENATFQLLVTYHNTKGRSLQESGWRYLLHEGAICHNIELESRIKTSVADIAMNLEELVFSVLTPIYEQFDFMELPRKLVTNVVADTLGYRR